MSGWLARSVLVLVMACYCCCLPFARFVDDCESLPQLCQSCTFEPSERASSLSVSSSFVVPTRLDSFQLTDDWPRVIEWLLLLSLCRALAQKSSNWLDAGERLVICLQL